MSDRFFEELLSGSPQSRRAFMQRLGAAGFAISGASTLLAACGGIEGEGGGNGNKPSATAEAVKHAKEAIGQLNISNWPYYIDKKTIKNFDKQFGGKTKYTEDVNDNEEFFGKVRQQLAQGRDIGRDIMVLTDWMAARCVRLEYCEPIDKANVPNAGNLLAGLKEPQWDPGRKFSLPWQSGMTAIGYNRAKTGGDITSYEQMFEPKYKGKITMLSDGRDASNLILFKNGKKPEDATIDDVLAAIEEIDEANRAGQIRRFTGNDYTTDLAKGNVWISQAYSGDMLQLAADNPDLKFFIPDEGGTLWTDNMLMPTNAEHYYAAETFMNYVYEPAMAARIAAYVNFVTPVVGAQEELAKIDAKLAESELIFPTEETQGKLHPYVNLDEDEERQMNEAMQAVVGA